jgi:hypothetical protein
MYLSNFKKIINKLVFLGQFSLWIWSIVIIKLFGVNLIFSYFYHDSIFDLLMEGEK